MKGVIFDLDGVIVKTDHYHYLAWKEIADQQGIYFDQQINNRLRGVSRMESLDIILGQAEKPYSQGEKLALVEQKNRRYVALLATLTAQDICPGVVETLDALDRVGIKTAIGSSSKNAGYILAQIGLTSRFPVIVDGNHIQHSKPHPQVFLLAAERLGLPPQACLVVEDAFAGIDAAVAAGMDSAGIGDASSYSKATHHITQVGELMALLEGMQV